MRTVTVDIPKRFMTNDCEECGAQTIVLVYRGHGKYDEPHVDFCAMCGTPFESEDKSGE